MNNFKIVNKTTFLKSKNQHKLLEMLFHDDGITFRLTYTNFYFLKK